MRLVPLALALLPLLAAVPAAAEPELGQRTGKPEQLFSGIGDGNSEDALAQEIAAASAHPLGSLLNPVRVGGPEGERAYIARLRCADGTRPKVGPRADGEVGGFGSLVSVYPLDCGAVAPGRTALMRDPYHEEHREDRAPAGLAIEPR